MDTAPTKWKFRPPPRGVDRESLRLCPARAGGEGGDWCQLAELCHEAHSRQELAEWLERWGEDHTDRCSVECLATRHSRLL